MTTRHLSLLISLSCIAAHASVAAEPTPAPSDRTALERSIALGTAYLARATGEDGRFVYKRSLDGTTVQADYNELRHAGAVYAMASAYQQLLPTPVLRDVIVRARDYLRNQLIDRVEGAEPMLAVWTEGERGKREEAKLGGAGLAMVALLEADRVAPRQDTLASVRQLAAFVVFMQKEDGGFHAKFFPNQGGRSDAWTSLYYPGEAALGLVMLYERTGNERWLRAAYRALRYLARQRAGKEHVPPDHWALIATARLLARPAVGVDIDRLLLVRHAVQVAESMLPTDDVADARMRGCLTRDGRTTPTATRLEGLLVIVDLLSDEQDELRKRILRAGEQGSHFLIRAQQKQGPLGGAVPRAIAAISDDLRAPEVRIDYVQHAISAWLAYRQLSGATPSPPPPASPPSAGACCPARAAAA